MKLILHIGTEKTGTTTLQTWCVANRERLRAQGVFYPASLGPDSHRDLAVYAMDADSPDESFSARGIVSAADHEAFRARLEADFARECADWADVPTCLISSEHLHSRLTDAQMVGRVKSFVEGRFDSVEVVVHLRPQVDVAVSRISTYVRGGDFRYRPTWLSGDARDRYYNYNFMVRQWESVFGEDAVVLVPFKRHPCITTFLAEKLQLDMSALPPLDRTNVALDWRTIAIVNAIVSQQPEFVLDDLEMHDWPVREPLAIDLETAQNFQSVFKQTNDWLLERRRDLLPDDLTPDWTPYKVRQDNLSRIDDALPFAEQLSYFATRMRSEKLIERCARHLAEHRLALAGDDAAGARAHLQDARAAAAAAPELDATAARLADLRGQIDELTSRN